jgi:hypothetical protein
MHDTWLTTKPTIMRKPIIVSNGTHEIQIYTVVNRGRPVCQLSFYEAGKRQRKTCGDVPQAHREAKAILGRLVESFLPVVPVTYPRSARISA